MANTIYKLKVWVEIVYDKPTKTKGTFVGPQYTEFFRTKPCTDCEKSLERRLMFKTELIPFEDNTLYMIDSCISFIF